MRGPPAGAIKAAQGRVAIGCSRTRVAEVRPQPETRPSSSLWETAPPVRPYRDARRSVPNHRPGSIPAIASPEPGLGRGHCAGGRPLSWHPGRPIGPKTAWPASGAWRPSKRHPGPSASASAKNGVRATREPFVGIPQREDHQGVGVGTGQLGPEARTRPVHLGYILPHKNIPVDWLSVSRQSRSAPHLDARNLDHVMARPPSSVSKATLSEWVPVRPTPAPKTFNIMASPCNYGRIYQGPEPEDDAGRERSPRIANPSDGGHRRVQDECRECAGRRRTSRFRPSPPRRAVRSSSGLPVVVMNAVLVER